MLHITISKLQINAWLQNRKRKNNKVANEKRSKVEPNLYHAFP